MDEEAGLPELISLFVDINQKGVKVDKFNIVKAIQREDILLKYVFNLIAIEQKRRKDRYYKIKRTPFSKILKRLTKVKSFKENESKVNYMWERLLELAIFTETKNHRKPVDILKMFISGKSNKIAISKETKENLKKVFLFLDQTYRKGLDRTKLAGDNTFFYTMTTTLLKYPELIKDVKNLSGKLITIALGIEQGLSAQKKLDKELKDLIAYSAKHTTDISNREQREKIFFGLLRKK